MKIIQILLVIIIVFINLGCSRSQPRNPVDGSLLVEDVDKFSHEEKVQVQKEMINRQEREKQKQQSEHLKLQRQEYYNDLTERFRD